MREIWSSMKIFLIAKNFCENFRKIVNIFWGKSGEYLKEIEKVFSQDWKNNCEKTSEIGILKKCLEKQSRFQILKIFCKGSRKFYEKFGLFLKKYSEIEQKKIVKF